MPSTPLAAHQRTHARAFSGVSTTPFVPPGARALIVEDARRDDGVGGAALLLLQREWLRRQLDAANRGDAVRHVELVDVLRFGRLAVVAEVRVKVDEPRHQIHAGAVDDFPRGALVRPDAAARRACRRSLMRAMRLRSITTFIGPAGGAPVPSITITLGSSAWETGRGPRRCGDRGQAPADPAGRSAAGMGISSSARVSRSGNRLIMAGNDTAAPVVGGVRPIPEPGIREGTSRAPDS